ncbi:MAG: FecR domain-containing protein [Halomonas sp.]|nr:FecR domain-containing protein [Halomonas sp.]MCC5904508.1 FecR domain-containing protein [Halomonas sp.]
MKKSVFRNSQPIKILACHYKRIGKFFLQGLMPGIVFWLLGASANASDESDSYHRVVPGDTLWNISERYYGTPAEWPVLQQLNTIQEPEKLQPDTLVDLGLFSPFPLTVLYKSGEAWLIRGSNEVSLERGDIIDAGAILQTGRGTSLALQMSDGARVVVPSMSRIVLMREGSKGITFYLEQGEVESYVPTRRAQQRAYNIKTNTGVLGVRGTHFRARYEDELLLTSIYEGSVVAQAQVASEQVSIGAGEGAYVGVTGDIQVLPLLPSPDDVSITSLMNDGVQIDVLSPMLGSFYRAQIAQDPSFLNILRDQRSGVSQLRFDPLPPGFYHLRIAPIDAFGLEGWSATFVIHHHGNQVSVEQKESAWVFEWPHRAQNSYRLQLAADHEFTRVLLDYEPQGKGPLKISRLPDNDVYWRVVSLDERTEISIILDTGKLNDTEN